MGSIFFQLITTDRSFPNNLTFLAWTKPGQFLQIEQIQKIFRFLIILRSERLNKADLNNTSAIIPDHI